MPQKHSALKLICLLVLSFCVSSSFAQNTYIDNTVTQLDIKYLGSNPGRIETTPNFMTVIEFPDLITDVSTGRDDLHSIEVIDDRILLRPNRKSGTTDLVVKAEGFTALFVLEVIEGTPKPRRYVVKHTRELEESNARAQMQTQYVEARQAESASASNGLGYLELPEWINVQVEARRDANEVTLFYTITNHGRNDLVTNAERLRFMTYHGKEIEYSISRLDNDRYGRVHSGSSESGVIKVSSPPSKPFYLSWPFSEMGTSETYLLSRTIP